MNDGVSIAAEEEVVEGDGIVLAAVGIAVSFEQLSSEAALS
jgi:hypothetical protein